MAKLDEYRQYIQNLLQQHASIVWDKRIQAQAIFDLEHDHYQLVYVVKAAISFAFCASVSGS